MAQWVYARDRITIGPEINDLIAAEVQAGYISPGDTLVFLAREITQSATWRVPDGHRVVIAADTYTTTGSWSPFGAPAAATMGVDSRGTAGTVGARGANGIDGVPSAAGSTEGKPGGPGGAGTPGTAGHGITLLARTLYPVMLNAAGGAGGAGGIGGRGGDGARGRIVSHADVEIESTSGGDGGPGGPGGAGGAGGDVSVTYVSPAMVEIVALQVDSGGNGTGLATANRDGTAFAGHSGNMTLPIPLVFEPGWAKGGAGGPGGPGGSPGATFLDISEGPRPDAGATGPAGLAGADGALTVRQVDDAGYWQQLRSALPADAREAWARYRYQLGRYYYRSFVPRHPERGGYLALARMEFLAAAQLGSPALAAAASEQVAWIESGLNGLGLPRDLSIKPDFDDFEQTYVQNAPLLAPLFQTAETFIQNAVAVKAVDNQLTTAASAVSSSLAALAFDVRAAQDELAAAQLNSNELDRQLNELQTQISKANAELTAAKVELEGAAINSTAVAVFSLIVNLIPTVAAAKGVVGVLVKTNNDPSLRLLLGTDDRSMPLGGLAFAINEVGVLWGLGKTEADIAAASVSSSQAKIKDLMKRLVKVIFQRKRQELETAAADRRLDAANARSAAAQADLAALQRAVSADVRDLRQIAGILEELLTAIGRLGELVVRNVFLAARALDILLFNDSTVVTPPPPGAPTVPPAAPLAERLPLDFGLVHPDTVAEALLELRRGGLGTDRATHATAALTLAGQLAGNWQQAPAWIVFKDAANSLLQRLNASTAWLARNDADLISSLRQTGRAGFIVSLADLPAAACELRIKRVSVVLVGATVSGSVPSVVGKITHGGYAQVLRRDGAELLVDGPALTDLVTAVVTGSSSPVGGGSVGIAGAAEVPVFFGRSPATHWELDLSGPLSQGLDLSGLSAVQLGVEFYGTPAPTAPSSQMALLDGVSRLMVQPADPGGDALARLR